MRMDVGCRGIAKRAFFAASKVTPSLTEYREKRLIGYSQQQLFNIIVDVNRYAQFVPWCASSRIKTRQSHRIPGDRIETVMHAELGIGFKAFNESYTSKVVAIEPSSIKAVAADSSIFRILTNSWTLTPAPHAALRSSPLSPTQLKDLPPHQYPACYLDFYVAFEFRSLLYAQVSALFLDEVSKMMVASFEKRAHQLYGPPSLSSCRV